MLRNDLFDRRTIVAGLASLLALPSASYGQRRGGRAIVIGAGAAGLSCAQNMRRAGLDVVVLEAQDRIGGRLCTSRDWPDMPVEMGASWIHGVTGNQAGEMAAAAGLILRPTDYDNRLVYSEFDGLINQGALDRLESLERRLERYASNAPESGLEKSCYSRPRGTLENRLIRLMRLESPSAAKRRRGLFVLNSLIEHEYAVDFEALSRCFWSEGEDGIGGDAIVTGGFDQLTAFMAEGLDIRLSQTVERVDYSNGGVRVTTRSGSEDADVAVVTVPLGVLQHGAIRFSPGLPDIKQNAIQALGSGLLNKCILRFDRTYWPEQTEMFNRLANERGAWTEFLNLAAYDSGPGLVCFNASSFARELETQNNAETAAAAMEALRGMFGSNLPDPIGVQVSRWGQDPFAYGSYSYPGEHTRRDTRIRLLEPIDQRVFFAGEATSTHAPGTVHGAILSGRAAANAVVER
jgi:monoamine oxidase